MWQQVYDPNPNIAYVGGLCEGYVEGTAGQATVPTAVNHNTYGVYPSAAAAWKANYGNGNHPVEQPPSGVKVAVHFSLKNNPYDHIAVWLGDGRVASSTQAGFHTGPYVHPSLQDLINVYTKAQGGCIYLGWSEYIGKQQTVKKGEDMIPNENIVQALFGAFRGRIASPDEVKKYVNTPYADLIVALNDGIERRQTNDALTEGKTAINDKWQQQIKDLIAQNEDLKKQLADKPTQPTSLKPGVYEVK